MSYIVLGHASESLTRVSKVPEGCMFILAEECGVKGTFPHPLFSIFSNAEYTHLFMNPIENKERLEKLLNKKFKIYQPNQEYPVINYTLLNDSENTNTNDENILNIEPSGVYKLPVTDGSWVYNSSKRGLSRYTMKVNKNEIKEEEIKRIFSGTVAPDISTLRSTQTKRSLTQLLKTNQESLFAKKPGIYYNFLCRSIEEEIIINNLLKEHFPKIKLHTEDSFNHISNINEWLQRQNISKLQPNQKLATDKIRSILEAVYKKRSEENVNSGKKIYIMLINLLSMKDPQNEKIREIIDSLDLETLNKTDSHNGYTPLAFAVNNDNIEIVLLLISKGVNIDKADYEGITPLMLACTLNSNEIAEALINSGAVVNMKSDDGTTSLQIASMNSDFTDIAQLLLDKGADPNDPDEDGDTALHIAASNDMSFNVEVLLRGGADPMKKNNSGLTPLQVAIKEESELCIEILRTVT